MLHRNHRSGHLKTEHTESLLLLLRHLGNWFRGLLSAHTPAPSILPLLEASGEGFLCNLPDLGSRIRFDVFHGCEMCPLESRKQPKVTRSEIQRVRWLGDDRNVLGEELLHNKR
jgi:hypothetical protein